MPFDPETGVPGPGVPLASGDSVCYQMAVAGGRVAVVGALGDRAMEVMEVRAGRFDTRSRVGSAWQRRYRPTPGRAIDIPGSAGAIETWLFSPPDAGDAALPLVIDFHGGPLGAWGPAPWLEVRLLVEAGIRVATPNIRGATGYGAAWVQAHEGRWGEVDDDDAMAVLDHLVAMGLADRDRIGLIGLSYGGYLVNWLLGAHPDRFAAGIADGGAADLWASWALSDSGPDFHRRAGMAEPLTPEGAARLWAAVAAPTGRSHPCAAADPAGRGRSTLPTWGQPPALPDAAGSWAGGGAGALPRQLAHLCGHRSTRPAQGPASPDARVVRAVAAGGAWHRLRSTRYLRSIDRGDGCRGATGRRHDGRSWRRRSSPGRRGAASGSYESQRTRNPAANASPAPVVSRATMAAVGTSMTPSRCRIVAPWAPSLTTTIGARSSRTAWSRPSRMASTSATLPKSRSGATAATRDQASRGPRSRIGCREARSTETSAPDARASSTARRDAAARGSV